MRHDAADADDEVGLVGFPVEPDRRAVVVGPRLISCERSCQGLLMTRTRDVSSWPKRASISCCVIGRCVPSAITTVTWSSPIPAPCSSSSSSGMITCTGVCRVRSSAAMTTRDAPRAASESRAMPIGRLSARRISATGSAHGSTGFGRSTAKQVALGDTQRQPAVPIGKRDLDGLLGGRHGLNLASLQHRARVAGPRLRPGFAPYCTATSIAAIRLSLASLCRFRRCRRRCRDRPTCG